ncbi:MAG: hypothetical protein GKS00_09495 [Alphaproteobacteria bacterium]|nr:hypothetical protein [Alphaproteobacteria bacterium]
MADGDISNLAGRVPLGRSEEPDEPTLSEDSSMQGRRWSPFWAVIFVFGAGLLSWGAIAAVVAKVVE